MRSDNTCDEEGCYSSCHKKKECSGINRGTQEAKWLCTMHRPAQQQETTPRKCVVGEGTIRINSNPMKCPKCDKLTHKACSGIPLHDKVMQW